MATFVAATVPVEKEGQTSALLDAALQVGEPIGTDQPQPERQRGAAEPKVGSFEAFMTSFGSPQRWSR